LASSDPTGVDLPLRLAGESDGSRRRKRRCVVSLTESEQEFVFEDVASRPGAVAVARLLGTGDSRLQLAG
jgi:hypothetical protein